MRRLLRVTWPFWLHSTATQIRNIDTALVALIASPAQAGFYAVASRLTGPLRILPVSLAAIVLPGVARTKGVVSRRVALLIVSLLLVMAAVYVALAAIAPWAVVQFLGETFEPAVLPVQLVCVGLIFGAAGSILVSILQARGRQRFVSMASLASSLFCVPAIAFGSAAWGAAGASLGLIASFAVQAVMLALGLRLDNPASPASPD